VKAQITNNNTTLLAAVQTETQARVDAEGALAQQVTTVQAQADTNTAAVQTVAKSYAGLNGQLAASYTIKTQITADGRTYVAGIGVGIDNSTGAVESQVLVTADRFAVISSATAAGASVTAPFVVQNGQTFINQAFIGTGWITNLMIGSVIQSDNFVSGSQGWQINKPGSFEINGTGGGGRSLFNANGAQTYDASGTLRARFGYLG